MDIKAYISSGILELYCAGALTERENREVEANAQKYPAIKAEIKAIQNSLDSYAQLHAVNPNPVLKDKILNQLEDKGPGPSTTKTVYRSNNFVRNFLALGLALALVLVYIGYNKLETASLSLESTKKELVEAKIDKEKADNQLKGCHDQMTTLIHKDTKIIPLSGMPISPFSKVLVYWNSSNHNTYVNIANLPAPPEGKQYQLWALVNGKPIDAGVFAPELHVLQTMKSINSAEAFAVTLENRGGSPSPTMDQMYVMGNI